MLARFNKEDLLKLASEAKVASQMPLKAVVAPTSSEEDEDTASSFIFTRKEGEIVPSARCFLLPGASGIERCSSSATLQRPSSNTVLS